MINAEGVIVVGAFGIVGGFSRRVAVVEEDIAGGTGFQVSDLDPDHAFIEQGIPALNVVREDCFVVRSEEAEVGAIFLGGLESKVSG